MLGSCREMLEILFFTARIVYPVSSPQHPTRFSLATTSMCPFSPPKKVLLLCGVVAIANEALSNLQAGRDY